MRKPLLFLVIFIAGLGALFLLSQNSQLREQISERGEEIVQDSMQGGLSDEYNPLSINILKETTYTGSDLVIEQELEAGSNYDRYIASYKSEGLKIFGLLTVPQGEQPPIGWPVVIFNHGYIPPAQYRTTERYVAYTDAFSRNGYILFRPDYRGHGNSEGDARGGYSSNEYTIDVLNAVASVKRYEGVDKERIGMWGHSMGGYITLRAMVARNDIKAGVIWAGVVASYPDLINNWRRNNATSYTPAPLPSGARRWREILQEQFGTPEENPTFWNSISANSFLSDISGPLQIQHGTEDTDVPVEFSQKLESELKEAGKTVEYYEYPGDDHNLSQNFNTAISRSVEFFDTYVK